MNRTLEMFSRQWTLNLDTLAPFLLKVSALLFAAAVVWWGFNLLVRRFRKRCRDRPFFQNSSQIFPLTKKAGHTTILILTALETEGEELTKTKHPKIFVGKLSARKVDEIIAALRIFEECGALGKEAELRAFFNRFLPEANISSS